MIYLLVKYIRFDPNALENILEKPVTLLQIFTIKFEIGIKYRFENSS